MIARTQGIPRHRDRGERGRGNLGGRQLAEHPRQGLELDPDPRRPGGQDHRGERAQGRRRGDDQGGAEEGRRRPELGQAAGAAVPGDAVGAQQRPGRRDLDARAVPDAGAHHRRRPHRDGAGAGARAASGRSAATSPATTGQPATRASPPSSARRSTSRSRTRRRTRRRSATCCRPPRRTCGCRSGAR